MDNDAKMLEKLGNAVTQLQIKYRTLNISDRMSLRPSLDQAMNDYVDYQRKLLEDGVISTDTDLADMENIRQEINQAVETQQLVNAIARLTALIALKI